MSKRILFTVDDATHKAFRHLAVDRGLSNGKLLAELVASYGDTAQKFWTAVSQKADEHIQGATDVSKLIQGTSIVHDDSTKQLLEGVLAQPTRADFDSNAESLAALATAQATFNSTPVVFVESEPEGPTLFPEEVEEAPELDDEVDDVLEALGDL